MGQRHDDRTFRSERRVLMAAALGAASGATALLAPPRALALGPRAPLRRMPAQRSWDPPPTQAPTREGVASLKTGAKLYWWDTGGSGEPIVLMHPRTGSARIWGYQQPAFAKAGYRVIAYSRRGHAGSEAPAEGAPTGSAVGDLDALMDHLGVGRFHLVGTAGGGFVVPDYALSHGDRLLSMTIACSQGGLTEPSYRALISTLTPPGFANMPQSFRELGPSYRAGNRRGTEQWEALEHSALSAGRNVFQTPDNTLGYSDLERIRTPALVFTGGADLYAPPPLNALLAAHLQDVEIGVLEEAGHSGYWEQYLGFNTLVLDFIRRHRAR